MTKQELAQRLDALYHKANTQGMNDEYLNEEWVTEALAVIDYYIIMMNRQKDCSIGFDNTLKENK